MARKVILITGNIGAGKSTVIKHIEERKREIEAELERPIVAFPEQLDKIWRKNFYRDREKYTKGFEFNALSGRVGRHTDAKEFPGYAFFDRGMIEGAENFAFNSYIQGFFRWRDYQNYLGELRDGLDDLKRTEAQSWLESLIVYLEVKDTRILKERTDRRAEEEDLEKIPFEYLKVMNEERYPHFINNLAKIYLEKYAVPMPDLLTIDASVDMKENTDYLSEIVNKIIDRIK